MLSYYNYIITIYKCSSSCLGLDTAVEHSWYYQQRHHCYVHGKTHLDIINIKTLSQCSRMVKANETFERLFLYASAGNIIRHNQTLSYCSRLVRPSRGCSCTPRQAEASPAGPAPGCWGAAPGRRPGQVVT